MLNYMIYYNAVLLSPFASGGDFRGSRTRTSARALLVELQAELEDVRCRRNQAQERMASLRKQLTGSSDDDGMERRNTSAYGWLTAAAAMFIFGLLFSTEAITVCGSCGRFTLTPMLIVLGLVFAVRGSDEGLGLWREKRSHRNRRLDIESECSQLAEQISTFNLRELELEDSIRSAKRLG